MSPVSFSDALEALRMGSRISRAGWNGRGMWLILIHSEDYRVEARLGFSNPVPLLSWIGMKTAAGAFIPWVAQQSDLLEDDWNILD